MEIGFNCWKIQAHYWQTFLGIGKKMVLKLYILDKHEFNLQDKVTGASNVKGLLQAMERADLK